MSTREEREGLRGENAVVTSDDVSELAYGVSKGGETGLAQGLKIDGGQKTVRSNIFSFEGVVGFRGLGCLG